MKWLLLIAGCLILLLLLLMFTKIKVYIDLKHVHKNDQIQIKLSAWFGLFHYTFKVPVIKKDEGSAAITVKKEQGRKEESKKEETKKSHQKIYETDLLTSGR